ncbi:hypothetical protein GBF38_018803 [Xyrichtys novacula]|uniref:Uncharacterized protein n=1 Tax=Xyrichtys novacula TaxID=13765 RepID=A0AAV1FH37_XYRNO|nr:hypothetical protein GBF38_018803 [Xyrichtys novacula]
MDKTAVTRTVSIGGISRVTRAKEDFSAGRRHSSAGVRALLWATSSAKSLGCSLGSDSQISRENIYPNILTPDSIPQFTIPSLSVQNSSRSSDKEKEEDLAEPEEGLGSSLTEQGTSFSSSSSSSSRLSSSTSCKGIGLALSERRAERSVSDPLNQRRSHPSFHAEAQHCLDPASRAALSLPHLTKVTTPYGFITLSQSPQMVSEEALLCQSGVRRLNKDEETACRLRKASVTGTLDNKNNSPHLFGNQKRLSEESNNSQSKRGVEEMKGSSSNRTDAATISSNTQRQRDGKLKQRLCNIIRKHFTSQHLD